LSHKIACQQTTIYPDEVPVTTTALDADTAARLRAVVGKLSRRLNALARGSGLTPSQLSALGVIARMGPIRLSEVAEVENVNPTMLSRVVAALDEAGLVRRRTDPDDRRAGLLEVTASGRRTHDRLRAERGRVLTAGLEQLDPRELAALEAALPALESLTEALVRRERSR
jgi:DNA-binding MarR family transcriptional regulator